ncbi:MAG: glycoside hydrolase family 13 protein [Clostridia bacterium]|nr:glycoside hydrolase family 13 protein [Clostridia bacterium]
MLSKINDSLTKNPIIKKTREGKDVTNIGAFAFGDVVCFTVEAPREFGASAVVLRICKDGGEDRDYPFSFTDSELGVDTYSLELDTAALCGPEKDGLFYYEILFLRGYDTLFTNTYNYVDFELSSHSEGRFLMLVYKKDYTTPAWFRGKVMYQIFVDRFFKGEGKVESRDDVVMNEDWDNGIPQYPKKSGDALKNNMFFGGNLWGVAQKLPYLKELGVGVIYLCPIFKAYSNHKYDTGNYLEVDGMFGGDEAFENLIKRADEYGIKIILDGVFNHTGDDSLYFDKYGNYGGHGAYSDPSSPFVDWFRFRRYPDEYEDWWGIKILPKLNHSNDSCRKFFTDKGGVTEKYVKMGIGGWRLDVVDELPDNFLDEMRETVKAASDGEAMIIGEVWENAAEKISYNRRRRYLRGDQLDSVMNYPLRNGILSLLLDKDTALLADTLKAIYASYPKCVCDGLMNLLGTHDTQRIITVLGEGSENMDGFSNDELATRKLTDAQRARAVKLLKIAAAVQYTVYGVPSVFYGDEVGLEGYHDPFCRKPFPWGREDMDILDFYKKLGAIRAQYDVFADGDFAIECASGAFMAYSRTKNGERITVALNVGIAPQRFEREGVDLLTCEKFGGFVPAQSVVILR